MGFHPEACKRAVFFTQNSGLETATQWIMEHIGDSDFNDPFVPPGTNAKASAFVANPAGLEMLQSMGFTVQQATKALKETDNNIERAADWIFSHQMEIDAIEIGDFSSVGQEPSLAAPSDGNSSKWNDFQFLRKNTCDI